MLRPGEGEEETEEAYERMEDIYKRFHGITGEACHGRLGLVLCAHKSDLAQVSHLLREMLTDALQRDRPIDMQQQDNLEEEELTDAVKHKLRVEALQTCTWCPSPMVPARQGVFVIMFFQVP